MVELIVTMVIVGILAVAVIPRFETLSAFDARGFRDQTLSTLRFAQKIALAQRRAVCVTTSNTGVTLKVASTATDNNACDDGVAFTLPFQAKPGTGLEVKSFNYLRQGETDQSSDITLTITGATTITVDYLTGHAR